jgi:RNA polymerase sigma-70 factor (ECF subfamily)
MMTDTGSYVADLVGRARDPDASLREQHSAFTILVQRFERIAFATALAASSDVELARDACQEAFLVAWRNLPQLREPAAFGNWLRRLVRTQCARQRRRRSPSQSDIQAKADTDGVTELTADPEELVSRREAQRLLRRAVGQLPAVEREAVTLFYFLGEPLRVIADVLGVSVGNAGKLVYSARLRLRRNLPRSLAERFLALTPTAAFARRVAAGVFDEFVGEYQFPNRPDHRAIIRREGDALVGYAGGQRNVLASRASDSLEATEFDGEARFQRNRHGRISHFVYYEFGRRLGVARRVLPSHGNEEWQAVAENSGARISPGRRRRSAASVTELST